MHQLTSMSERLTEWRGLLPGLDLAAMDDDERLALLREIELTTRSLSAVAVQVQVGFYTSQVARQIEQGVAPSRAGRAVPDDLAAARMTSPYWGSRELTSAKALVVEMPCTLAALATGTIDDYQARAITEATACLSPELRTEVDQRLANALDGASTREMVATARGLVYEVDPQGYVDRARRAAKDRGVTIRPCPDVMGLLSARLPAPEAIACYSALRTHATAMQAAGDPRTLQQLMADELFSRLTGRSVVDGIDVEVGLVITDAALFGGTSDAADLVGYGPVPAETARDLLRPRAEAAQDPGPTQGACDGSSSPDGPDGAERSVCPDGARCTDFACSMLHGVVPDVSAHATGQAATDTDTDADSDAATSTRTGSATDTDTATATATDTATDTDTVVAAKVWLRRLFADPATGRLLTRDTRKRFFTGALRDLVIARDQTCRHAWCGAPIRHVDHIQRFADDGATDDDNGQGLCARCNLAREHPRQLRPPPESYRPPPPVLPVFRRAS
ncbi:HNH endonuclease [Ornithinimicrobium cerasi]|uniref:HNH endonuclease n=1 Tax=Ornithinimicrobium cerasi TaxID=2248773 RepID=A0A285VDJ7_9MICO|nr:DUF222 domain-containing protein [Ornithinimicrobium cerasi]SOC52140.1 HNH endonuclease [Ornithinimicrobium cerasi]